MKKINDRIKQLREAVSLSQSEFAVKAGLSIGNIWNIENSDVTPSARTLRVIQAAFNVNPEWLKTGKGEMFLEKVEETKELSNPWRDEAYTALKEEVKYLRELLKVAMGKANFPKTPDVAGISYKLVDEVYSGAITQKAA